MDLTDLLKGPLGNVLIDNVAGQFGLNKKEAGSAVGTAIPVILGGMTRNAKSKTGADSLDKALSGKHDGSLLDNLGSLLGGGGGVADLQKDGGGILGHVFGKNTGAVQTAAAKQAGISADKMAGIFTMLAPIVMAYLGKQKRSKQVGAGGLGDLLGGLLGGGAPQKSSGGLGGLLGGLLGGGSGKSSQAAMVDGLLDMVLKKK